MSRSLRTLILILAVVVLPGCTIRTVTNVSVDEDGSGTASITIALDEEFRELVQEESGEDFDWSDVESYDEMDLVDEGVAADAEVSPYVEGEFEGVTVEFSFESLDELNSLLSGEFAGEDTGAAVLQISEVEEGRFELSVPDEYMDELSDVEGDEFSLPASVIEDLFDIQISAQLPGKIVEHNGTLDGDTVSWSLSAGDETQEAPYAVSEVSSGIPVLPFVLGAVVVLLALLGLSFIRGRQGGQVEPAADAEGASSAAAFGGVPVDEIDRKPPMPPTGLQ